MKQGQTIRIACLLLAIFGAGMFTGWMLAPRENIQVVNKEGSSKTIHPVVPDFALARFTAEVNLDAEQQNRVRPIFEEIAQKMSAVPPGTNERLIIFISYLPRLKKELRTNQYEAFELYADEAEKRFKRRIRQQQQRMKNAP